MPVPAVGRGTAAAPPVYSGRAQQLIVRVPRIPADIAIDGTLNDPVWQQAALLTGFSEYKPVDGLPAEDSTEVLVWYSPRRDLLRHPGLRAARPPARDTRQSRQDRRRRQRPVDLESFPALAPSARLCRQPLRHSGRRHDHRRGDDGRRFNTGATRPARARFDGPEPGFRVRRPRDSSRPRLPGRGPDPVPQHQVPVEPTRRTGASTLCGRCSTPGTSDTWYPTKLAASSFLDQSGTLVGLTRPRCRPRAGPQSRSSPNKRSATSGASAPGWRYGVERPAVRGQRTVGHHQLI